MRLVRAKCSVHVLAWIQNPDAQKAQQIEAATGICVAEKGILLMGTVVGGRYAAPLYAEANVSDHPAVIRVERAERLGAAVRQMEKTALPIGTSQAACVDPRTTGSTTRARL